MVAEVQIPEWAKGVRVNRLGIICTGGRLEGMKGSEYHAGPFHIADMDGGQWGFWHGTTARRLYLCRTFKEARWMATRKFIRALVEDAIGPELPDEVSAILATAHETGDWLTFRVLADKLGDLGHHEAEALVRHFLPK